MFKDQLFWKALGNTLLIGIIAHIPILLGIGFWLIFWNSKTGKRRKYFQDNLFYANGNEFSCTNYFFSNYSAIIMESSISFLDFWE